MLLIHHTREREMIRGSKETVIEVIVDTEWRLVTSGRFW